MTTAVAPVPALSAEAIAVSPVAVGAPPKESALVFPAAVTVEAEIVIVVVETFMPWLFDAVVPPPLAVTVAFLIERMPFATSMPGHAGSANPVPMPAVAVTVQPSIVTPSKPSMPMLEPWVVEVLATERLPPTVL